MSDQIEEHWGSLGSIFNLITLKEDEHPIFEILRSKYGVSRVKSNNLQTLHMSSKISFFCLEVSEFPNNCSSMVLGNVSSFLSYTPNFTIDMFNNLVSDIARVCGYALVFCTLVNEEIKEKLVGQGWKVIQSAVNLHSGLKNYFLVYELEYSDEFIERALNSYNNEDDDNDYDEEEN